MNIIIKLVRMPEGPMSEGGGMLTIELADCSGIEVRSENHFVVAPNSGLEVEGGSYGAVFVLGPTRYRKVWDTFCVGELSERAIANIATGRQERTVCIRLL